MISVKCGVKCYEGVSSHLPIIRLNIVHCLFGSLRVSPRIVPPVNFSAETID